VSAFLQGVARDRIQGDKPSVPRAVAAAVVAGVVVAVITYKLLRS
jgi:hypothetical protein